MSNLDPTWRQSTAPPTAGAELRDLSDAECLGFLQRSRVGRLGLSMGSLPVILPVNFVIDDDAIVFCTGNGTKLSAAADGNVACLQIDDLDASGSGAWSVLATGRLQILMDPIRIEAARVDLAPLRHIEDPNFVQLSIDLLSGRSLDRSSHGPVADQRGSHQPE